VIVAAIVGARAMQVLSHLSYYTAQPSQIIAVWQGGLSSFGGLIAAVPVAIVSSRRRCPELPSLRFADLMAPVLMACWGMGRLLGPQLMVAGGGARTGAWYGMAYAGEVGRRVPVPIFQAIGDFAIFGILLLLERRLRDSGPRVASDGSALTAATAPLPPSGIVIGVGMVLWGIERYLDEAIWLHGQDGALGSFLVELAGIGLVVAGVALLAARLGPYRRWRHSRPDPVATPSGPVEGGPDSADGEATSDGDAAEEAEMPTPAGASSAEGD
jgi:hypothetical protein